MANTFTKNPKIGDAVVGNLTTKEVQYITADSFNLAELGGEYETIGVVYRRNGKKVGIAYKSNASKKWSERYSFKLGGYTLDGTNRSGVLSIRQASDTYGTAHDYAISYNAASVASLVEQLNSHFTANEPFITQDFRAVANDDGITIHMKFVDYRQANDTAKRGFTFTANLLPESQANAQIRRKNGYKGGEGAISSYERALVYFRNPNTNANYHPTTAVTTVKRNYPVTLPYYLSDFGSFLRSVYGEGEEGWKLFMRSCMPVKPTDYGSMQEFDGLSKTKYLAEQRYDDNQVLCPAADYCYNIATECIPKGNWYLPTTREVSDLLDVIKYNAVPGRGADVINATLQKMGGSAISNGSGMWSCCRYSASYAWYASDNYGFFNGNRMYNSNLCVPVCSTELP